MDFCFKEVCNHLAAKYPIFTVYSAQGCDRE